MPGQIPPFALLPSWKYILVTSSHHVVCLQCLSLPSWAACMFVFGFVADSLAAATAGPLLGQFSDWKCWRLENLTEEVVAGGNGHYTHPLDVRLFLQFSSPCKARVRRWLRLLSFRWRRTAAASGKFCESKQQANENSQFQVSVWLAAQHWKRTIREA